MAATMIILGTYSTRTGHHGSVHVAQSKVKKLRESLAREGVQIVSSRPVRSR